MSDSDKLDARLGRVYNNPGDKQALFDDWADSYDHDLVDDLGYVADAEACKHFIERVPDRSARILDAGCGTGLVGRRLKAAGYDDLHGRDYSTGMLEQAEVTAVYRSLGQQDLTRAIVEDTPFDAVIAVGVFAFSLPSAEHLVHLTDCLHPGGLALVTVNGKAWREVDWPAKLADYDARYPGSRLLAIEQIDYLKNEGIDGRLLILERRR